MNLNKINEFLAEYAIDPAVKSIELPRTTSGNTSYLLTVQSGNQYVLRTLVRQTAKSAEDEYKIQATLHNAGIITPLYLTSLTGRVSVTKQGTSVVISRLIKGSRQPIDTLELAGGMGEMLARIHNTLLSVSINPNEQQWFNITNVKKQLERYSGPDKAYLSDKTDVVASTLFTKDLPKALTHGDFHTNNVFSKNNKVTAVFDFESAEYTLRIFDIARLYLTYRKVTNLHPDDILKMILRGYSAQSHQPLLAAEREALNDAFIYVALVSSVSIYNHGNAFSSGRYRDIAKNLISNTTKITI